MSSQTTVVLVEDHSLIRDGLRMLLATEREFLLIGEAATVAEGRTVFEQRHPDMMIVDVGLPDGDGLELAKDCMKKDSMLRILVMTGDLAPATVGRALAIGAHAYVPKQHSSEEFFKAMHALRAGGRYVSPAVAASYAVKDEQSPLSQLTPREREIVSMIADAQSSKEIARTLDLSVATVRKHRENLMTKLDVHSVAELIALVMKTH
jgi:DNA-binding NarL/FixJ family response regulator